MWKSICEVESLWSFNGWIDKKGVHKMSYYVPKQYERFCGNIEVELDLSRYVTNADSKEVLWI